MKICLTTSLSHTVDNTHTEIRTAGKEKKERGVYGTHTQLFFPVTKQPVCLKGCVSVFCEQTLNNLCSVGRLCETKHVVVFFEEKCSIFNLKWEGFACIHSPVIRKVGCTHL